MTILKLKIGHPMPFRPFRAVLLMLCLNLAGMANAYASPIIYISDSNGYLGTVDVANGAVQVIGHTGHVMTDIAFDPNGNLYAIDFSNLYKVNPNNAAATLIGGLGISDANALVFATNGTLYTAGTSIPQIYTVNTNTGAAANLGTVGNGITSYGDLAFNGGQLYLAGSDGYLVDVNLANTTHSFELGFIGFSNVWGLATGDNGILYGVANTQIFSINTNTGTGTFILDYSGKGLSNVYGAATLQMPTVAATYVGCLFNWAQTIYPSLFSPASASLQNFLSYTYRYYANTNAYVGVSSTDNHVYYLGPDNILRDEGPVAGWLNLSNCQTGGANTNTGNTQTGGTTSGPTGCGVTVKC